MKEVHSKKIPVKCMKNPSKLFMQPINIVDKINTSEIPFALISYYSDTANSAGLNKRKFSNNHGCIFGAVCI